MILNTSIHTEGAATGHRGALFQLQMRQDRPGRQRGAFLRKTTGMRGHFHPVLGVLSLVLGLAAAPGASAATTTLTFDDLASGVDVTNQYQSIGILTTGATALSGLASPWPANSSPNIAYSPLGLMTFTINSTITGDIQTVSAYISGDTSVGIYAYDAANNLVGSAVTPGATDNVLLSVTSSGGPIASIQIHDGGSSFAIDTLDFMTAPPPPPPQFDTVPPLTTGVLVAPNPVPIGMPVTLSATVDDSTTGNSPVAGAWYTLDGGSPVAMAAQDGAFNSPIEGVTAQLGPFAVAGVYRPCVQGTDSANNTGAVGVCTALAVYDPSAGFVTGGGKIVSPPGAYFAQPNLAGKAEFGFVSRYKKGATVPNGEMEFEYAAESNGAHAHFHFRSYAYAWLVLNQGIAQFTGSGRIDGTGDYGFSIVAVDGQVTGSGEDLFHIKIWDKLTGDAFYNNEPAADWAMPTTPLAEGAIQVRNK